MAITEYKTGEANSTHTINKKSIPHASLPIGGTYNDSWVSGSSSCVGFGKYISNYLYGSYNPGTSVAVQNLNNNQTVAYNVISGFKVGSRLTGFKNGAQIHTWILVARDTTGAVLYHANFGSPYNNVKLSKWTYDEFLNRYDQISGYNAP